MPPTTLADARTGLCTSPEPGPGPWPLADVVARYRATVNLPGRRLTVAGAGLTDESAYLACVGEGLERYAALVARAPAAVATTGDLDRAGQRYLAPAALAVAAVPGDDVPLPWAAATDGRLVPLAAVRGNLTGAVTAPHHEYPQGSTGLAAGRDLDAAVEAAAAEVLERDVLARAWTGDDPWSPTPESVLPRFVRDASHAAGLEVRLHLLPAAAGSAVTVVALRDPDRGYLGVGAAYRRDRTVAATKAWLEAVVSLAQAAELAHPETGPVLAEAAGLAPWRGDRSYAADGWVGVTDLAQHAQLLLDPDLAAQVWARLDGPTGAAPATSCGRSAWDLLTERYDVVAIDLTPPDLATQLSAVRVLAAGAHTVRPAGLTPETLPCPLL